MYPEATISRSFELKEFKSGAARMAIAADVPIIPHIVGVPSASGPRITRKDVAALGCRSPVAVGEPIQPTLPNTELTALLRSACNTCSSRCRMLTAVSAW